MNRPLRRVALFLVALFAVLLLNADYLQVVDAQSLRANPHNGRQLLDRLRRERGPIVAGGVAIADSVPSNDTYRYQRAYPLGALYAPVTGYASITFGNTSLEKSQDDILSGADDRLFVRQLSDYITGNSPRGGTVQTTIIPAVQQIAAQQLGNHKGAVVALDPRTGAILALVTSPSYDPNALASHDSAATQKAFAALNSDPNDPALDRATQGVYPPGSLFKIVTAAAALSTGRYNPDSQLASPTTLPLPGTASASIGNFGGEVCGDGRNATMLQAFTISCNTTFAQLGMDLGQDTLRRQAQAFGIGTDLPNTFSLPYAGSVFPSTLNLPQLAQSSIGQYDVRISPLQAAMIVSAVADGGHELTPYIVDRVLTPQLKTLDITKPSEFGRPISAAVADQLTQLMISVVNNGTGTAAQIPGVQVAGKTGTAQNAPGKAPHAWFGAFAPAGDPARPPTVAVSVIVENGGSSGNDATGGTVAAPIAREVIKAVLAAQNPGGGTP
ncbi:MAG TPA: penicillin-binding protein 2 [Frankiaceae bacterium]